jgi:hypothetical protein
MRRLSRVALIVGMLAGITGAAAGSAQAAVATPPPKPAVFRDGLWLLRNTLTGGPADLVFGFGRAGDFPVMGDWDGNGSKTVGIVRGSTWYLRNSNSAGRPDITLTFGGPQDFPVAGDWNGDGRDTPGVVRCPSSPCTTPVWYVRNSASTGRASTVVKFGVDGFPIVADWDGDGDDTPAVTDDAMVWGCANTFGNVAPKLFTFGRPGDQPVAGAWGIGGAVAPGVVRDGLWLLRNRLSGGPSTSSFRFGRAGDFFLVWQ